MHGFAGLRSKRKLNPGKDFFLVFTPGWAAAHQDITLVGLGPDGASNLTVALMRAGPNPAQKDTTFLLDH